MLVKTFCAAVMGLEATTITIEVNMTRGVMFHLSGLADTAVKESYDRIRAAMSNIGFKPPTADLTINLSPADIRKEGSSYDLPLAVGILAAHGKVSDTMLSDYMMIGELGLDGKLKPVSGALPVAIRARKEKFKGGDYANSTTEDGYFAVTGRIPNKDRLMEIVENYSGCRFYRNYRYTIISMGDYYWTDTQYSDFNSDVWRVSSGGTPFAYSRSSLYGALPYVIIGK